MGSSEEYAEVLAATKGNFPLPGDREKDIGFNFPPSKGQPRCGPLWGALL